MLSTAALGLSQSLKWKSRAQKKKKTIPWGAIIQNDTEENSKSQHSPGYTAEVRTAERCLSSEGQPAASAFPNLHSPLSVLLKKRADSLVVAFSSLTG